MNGPRILGRISWNENASPCSTRTSSPLRTPPDSSRCRGTLPVPSAFDNFPPYSIDLRNAHVESGTLVIPAVVVLGGEENPGRYRLLAKLQLTTLGKGCLPGMLRNYLADASCDSSVVYIRVPDSLHHRQRLKYVPGTRTFHPA